MLSVKPTPPPPPPLLRAATALTPLPSCILGRPCKGLRGGGTWGAHRGWGPSPGRCLPPTPPHHHRPGTPAPRAGVQSQRAGAGLGAGKLAPAEGGAALQGKAGAGGDGEEVDRGWGFLLGRERDRQTERSLRSTAPLSSRGGNGSACSAIPTCVCSRGRWGREGGEGVTTCR